MLSYAKTALRGVLQEGDTAVDATMGTGQDTEFLAETVGSSGTVFAFDVQPAAVDTTRERLGVLTDRTRLILDSHANMAQYVTAGVSAVMFNLGFLPNGEDRSIITAAESTVPAIRTALRLLKPGGMVSVAVYDGHPGGAAERDAVLELVQALDSKEFQVIRYETVNTRQRPPFLLLIEKSAR